MGSSCTGIVTCCYIIYSVVVYNLSVQHSLKVTFKIIVTGAQVVIISINVKVAFPINSSPYCRIIRLIQQSLPPTKIVTICHCCSVNIA